MTFRLSFRRSAVALAVAAAAALAVAAALTTTGGDDASPLTVHADKAVDTSDDRRLVGFADNVFVGRVVAKSGQTDELSMPETQFSVEVLDTVKGSLAGTVTVNQFGGVADGQTVLLEGDALLEPGETYLLATRTRADRGWETVVASDGKVKVKGAEHGRQLKARFADAKAKEIPFKLAG